MDSEAAKPERKKISPIKVVLVSAAVLGLIAIIGAIALCRQVATLQKNEYYGMDVGHMVSQVFGLDSKNLKDVAENSQIYQKGCMYFVKGVMADRSRDWDGAISLYLQALDQFKQYPGWNNTYAFDSMDRLADDYENAGKLRDAEQWHKNSIECAIKSTNKKHALVSSAYRDLGVFYSHLGRYAESIKAFQSALAIDKAGAGATADKVGQDYWWIGDQQGHAEQYANAIESLSNARAIGKEKWKDTDLGGIAIDQGRCALKLHNNDRALEFFEKAQQYFGSHDGDHGYYSTRLWMMTLYRDSGNFAKADEIAKDSFPTKLKIAKNDDELGSLYGAFADYYMSRSNYLAAEQLLREQLAHDRGAGKKEFHNVLLVQRLGDCLVKEHKKADASNLYDTTITSLHKADVLPPVSFLKSAIEVFRSNKMIVQLKSAESDLRKIESRSKSAPTAD